MMIVMFHSNRPPCLKNPVFDIFDAFDTLARFLYTRNLVQKHIFGEFFSGFGFIFGLIIFRPNLPIHIRFF